MNREEFRHPGAIYRAAPFWSWNDDLQSDELEWQARDIGTHGWGGYFMHSRVGLITPYLSDEWMNHIRHSVEVAKDAGLVAYLYDEDKWPSGYAGGLVPRQNEDYRNCGLQCTLEPPSKETNTVMALHAKRPGGWERIHEKSQAGEDPVAYVSKWVEPMGNPWFNGATYVDLMNPEAVQAFVECTLEPYAELVGEHFGTTILGCFTDEPSYMFWHTKDRIARDVTVPWTKHFIEEFEKRWGYDILDRIMSVFSQDGNWRQVRYHFWRTAMELFRDAFSEPYGQWCREHNLQLTGHYMLEDTLDGQIRWGGAMMPHYEHMGWPGMDHLGRNINNVMTAKQVTSVAHQLGKKRTLSELYGCSGQHLSFEGRKWIADWHFVHGINLMNPHLTLYSMRGERKRDYPPTVSYQQPWWRFNYLIADYKARLSYALTRGRRVSQALVIHPIESAWCVFSPSDEGPARRISDAFDSVGRWLLEAHYDFDYGDESLLAKYARIDGDKMRVGEAEYEVVIVPPGVTLRTSTLELLREWMDRGGPVIAVKPVPRLVDGGTESDAWEVLKDAIVVEQDAGDFAGALSEMVLPMVQVLSPEGFPVAPVWFHHRREQDREIYFFANTDRSRGYDCQIVLRGDGMVDQWDPRNGDVIPVPVERAGGHVVVDTYLDASGSLLLVYETEAESDIAMDVEPLSDEGEAIEGIDEIDLDGPWDLTRRDPNALTLDMARLRLGQAEWGDAAPLWKALRSVRAHLGEFALEFAVDVQTVPAGDVFLVLERPDLFEIAVNDGPVDSADAGWWVDKSFRKRELTGLLHEGMNRIVLSGTGSRDIELESVYLIGDFGVWSNDFRAFQIGEEPTDTLGGDLVEQGYPFFAGTISLSQTIELSIDSVEAARLVIGGFETIVADVWINGKNAGQAVWPPYEREIARYLKDGPNTIRIDLVHSLRNLLGPHHHEHGELLGVGPDSFADERNWTDVYQFVPFGMSDAHIVVVS